MVSSHIALSVELDEMPLDLALIERKSCVLKKRGVEKQLTFYEALKWTDDQVIKAILSDTSDATLEGLETISHTSIGILDPAIRLSTAFPEWRKKNVIRKFAISSEIDETDWMVIDARRSIISLIPRKVYSSKYEDERPRDLACHFDNWSDLVLLYFAIYLSLWSARQFMDAGGKISDAVFTRLMMCYQVFERLRLESGWRDQVGDIERVHTSSGQVRALRGDILPKKGDVYMTVTKTIQIGPGASISAPVIIADQIANSFNTVAQSSVDDSVKQLISKLVKDVAEAARTTPPDLAQSMARDVESLSKEITSTKPRRKIFEVTIDGLKEAAIAVGEVGKQILETTAQLLPLLSKLFP